MTPVTSPRDGRLCLHHKLAVQNAASPVARDDPALRLGISFRIHHACFQLERADLTCSRLFSINSLAPARFGALFCRAAASHILLITCGVLLMRCDRVTVPLLIT